MDHSKLHESVKSDSTEIKLENISNEQPDYVNKVMNDTVMKENKDQSAADLLLKRKIKEETSADNSNGESPTKRKRRDSNDKAHTTESLREDIEREMIDSTVEAEESIYSLLVSNFPETWTFQQICNYVSLSLEGVSVEMESLLGVNKNELRLTFNSADHRHSAQNALQDKEVDGYKLHVAVEGSVQDDNVNELCEETATRVHDIWEKDPKGLYGLKEDYLKTLNITPPITNWIHISNFRCDKAELRDALELAGNVVACSVVNGKVKYAKVMYSHPLEAVQAVSMLNDQMLYGKQLKVTMDKSSEILLPKGLTSVGPGLGEDGGFVREITREYERFLNGKRTKINLSLFTAGNINGIVISKKNNYSVISDGKIITNLQSDTTATDIKVNPTPTPAPVRPAPPVRPIIRHFGPNMRPPGPQMFRGPMPRGPMLGPMGEMGPPGPYRGFPPGPGSRMPMPFGPRPAPPGPIHPPGPMAGPAGLIPGHMYSNVAMAAAVPGAAPNWPNPQVSGIMPQMSKCIDATTLKICNLPPTTSFPSLCGKLSTLAQVTSLEFTTPGCAVVKFASPSDAEKCFQSQI